MNTPSKPVHALRGLCLVVALLLSLTAHAAPGDLDSLNVNVAGILGSRERSTAVQPSGKTIIVGYFNSVLGQPRNNVPRLNADGTLALRL